MPKIDLSFFRRHFLLTCLGAFLQFLGGLCFLAATILTLKDIRQVVRQYLEQEH